MNRPNAVHLALLGLFILLAFQNCGAPFSVLSPTLDLSSEESLPLARLQHAKSHVAYVGFYATAYNYDYSDQVKGLANLTHIDNSFGDINFIVNAIKNAKKNDLIAVVSLSNIFFTCEGWMCVPREQNLALEKWDQLQKSIKQNNLFDTILSFYIDEPEMYGRIRENDAALKGQTLSVDVIAELEFIAQTVKRDLPLAKMQMTSAAFDVRPTMRLPQGFDIFGMDCYHGWERCGTPEYNMSIPQYYDILNSKINDLERIDGKKRYLALFPPTMYSTNPQPWGIPGRNTTVDLFQKYIQFAETNSRIIAVIGFLWTDHVENGLTFHGAQNNSDMRSLVADYYASFTPRPPVQCDANKKPTSSEPMSCPAGYSGTAIRTRQVTCQEGQWNAGPWVQNTSACSKIPTPAGPGPAEPRVINYGIGCEDNLCLWVVVQSLTSSYEVYVRDPANFTTTQRITAQDAVLVKPEVGGSTSISFRIPSSYIAIFLNRGLDVVITNKLNNQSASWYQRFAKPVGPQPPPPPPPPAQCDANKKPTSSEPMSCPAGYSGTAIRTRQVTCQEGQWNAGPWVQNTSACSKIPTPAGPGPAEPRVINYGIGCEDNLCLWVVVQSLTSSYEVYVRDPANFTTTQRITAQDAVLVKPEVGGSTSISFRIPSSYVAIFRNRGLDVVVVNMQNSQEAKWFQRIKP